MKFLRWQNFTGVAAFTIALGLCASRVNIADAAPQDPKPAAGAAAGNAENGKKLFNKIGCYQCHGREGQGSSMSGPRIAPNPLPLDFLLRYVRKPTGEMPPYTAKVVSDEELTDIYAYLQSRPRPPAVKDIPLLK